MNYLENTFHKYVESVEKNNIHPELENMINNYSDNIEEFSNTIFYGPSGVGKYSQILKLISKYSKSNLKYSKKLCIQTEKDTTLMIHMSDIHYEIDIELLGCNSKTIFHSIYQQIKDIICNSKKNIFSKNNHSFNGGIILCKNFHMIQNELLECFYTYMSSNYENNIFFILHTEDIGFIPRQIIEISNVIRVSKPCKKNYEHIEKDINKLEKNKEIIKIIKNNKIGKKKIKEEFLNLKNFQSTCNINVYNVFIERYINIINDNVNNVQEIRDLIYNILTFNIHTIKFIYNLLNKLEEKQIIKMNEDILIILFDLFSFYEKHYRPVFHLEKFLVKLLIIINGNK
jgi:hypothetical protein